MLCRGASRSTAMHRSRSWRRRPSSMNETTDTYVVDRRDELQRMAMRLVQDLRDDGVIVFTSELECLGWYNEARRSLVSRAEVGRRRLGARVSAPPTPGRPLIDPA